MPPFYSAWYSHIKHRRHAYCGYHAKYTMRPIRCERGELLPIVNKVAATVVTCKHTHFCMHMHAPLPPQNVCIVGSAKNTLQDYYFEKLQTAIYNIALML